MRTEAVRPHQRVILALGGHEFTRRRGNEAIRDYMLALADARRPRICLLPTASGDAEAQIFAFRRSLGELECEPSHLSLFRLESERVRLEAHLLSQDLIYVGGGSMVNLMAIWRAHGLDRILRTAWERGIVLVGQSAGAMCWFEAGITRSAGVATVRPGLGLVPGILSVHYHRDPVRREALLAAVGSRGILGYGLDDQAGVLVKGNVAAAAVNGRDEAGVWRVEPDGEGSAREIQLTPAPLPDPRPAIDEIADDVAELRLVRATRPGQPDGLGR
jgi:peptidase E